MGKSSKAGLLYSPGLRAAFLPSGYGPELLWNKEDPTTYSTVGGVDWEISLWVLGIELRIAEQIIFHLEASPAAREIQRQG